jgi:hypothetical protein
MPLLLHDTLSRPEGTRETTEQGRDLAALLATVVQRGQEAGELRAEVDARVAAAVLVSGYFAVASEWIRQDDAFDLRAAAGQVLELVLGGLRVPAVRRRRRPREET